MSEEYRCTALNADGTVGPDWGCDHRRCAERAGLPTWECGFCGGWFIGSEAEWTDTTRKKSYV